MGQKDSQYSELISRPMSVTDCTKGKNTSILVFWNNIFSVTV